MKYTHRWTLNGHWCVSVHTFWQGLWRSCDKSQWRIDEEFLLPAFSPLTPSPPSFKVCFTSPELSAVPDVLLKTLFTIAFILNDCLSNPELEFIVHEISLKLHPLNYVFVQIKARILDISEKIHGKISEMSEREWMYGQCWIIILCYFVVMVISLTSAISWKNLDETLKCR